MGVIDRIASQIAGGTSELRIRSVSAEARRLLAYEAPLARDRDPQLIVDRVLGLGPIESLMRDPEVADVLVNGPDEIWVERNGRLHRAEVEGFSTPDAIVSTVERAIAPLGLRIDRSSPFVDARLPDGSRLHAVVPPAAVDSPIVAVRRFTPAVQTLAQLVEIGSASVEEVETLRQLVGNRQTVLVSGGTGTGKTTLLNLLAGEIPPGERIVTIEDAAELRVPGHVVRLEAHPPNAEGAGEITTRALLRSALRLRPDRIIVGEVRGPEALDLISALNTGHRGSMSTIHANSPDEAMWRLETLALSAGNVSVEVVSRQLFTAVTAVVQLERQGPLRRVSEIAMVSDA
jgi:pilus assembly protein CpaF